MFVRKKIKLADVLFSMAFWTTAFLLYYVFRKVGLEEEIGVAVNDPLSIEDNIILALFIGSFAGLVYAFLELIFEQPSLRRLSLGVRLIVKTLCYLLLIDILIQLLLHIQAHFFSTSETYTNIEIWGSSALWAFIIYFLFWSLLFSFIKLVSEKFGPGILPKMIAGRYRKPRVENKIFLFIDLKSSTKLAEELGYLNYSKLIQQCFYDLNEVVSLYDGQIYQYVGDEAVICWDYHKGIKDNRCLECFFAFQDILQRKSPRYMDAFGKIPTFKAGLHGGDLIVTEVGIIKKEIAYHGDVINTTARIQEQCNSFDSTLLISDKIKHDLPKEDTLHINYKGDIPLKGKEFTVKIYSVTKIQT